jgi:prepilin-type N-terminal cleavage/methylation domain-containing protein
MKIQKSGFTLVELLITIAIIAILAAVAAFTYSNYLKPAYQTSPLNMLMAASTAEEEYYADNGQYTCTIEDLTGFDDGTKNNSFVINPDQSSRRKFTLKVDNCTSDSYTLSIENFPSDPKWKAKWIISCSSDAAIGSCKPKQVEGSSSVLSNLF